MRSALGVCVESEDETGGLGGLGGGAGLLATHLLNALEVVDGGDGGVAVLVDGAAFASAQRVLKAVVVELSRKGSEARAGSVRRKVLGHDLGLEPDLVEDLELAVLVVPADDVAVFLLDDLSELDEERELALVIISRAEVHERSSTQGVVVGNVGGRRREEKGRKEQGLVRSHDALEVRLSLHGQALVDEVVVQHHRVEGFVGSCGETQKSANNGREIATPLLLGLHKHFSI